MCISKQNLTTISDEPGSASNLFPFPTSGVFILDIVSDFEPGHLVIDFGRKPHAGDNINDTRKTNDTVRERKVGII